MNSASASPKASQSGDSATTEGNRAEGFQKVKAEIALAPMGGNVPMPWGKESVQLYFGEVPIGDTFEPIIIRKGFVRQLLLGGKIGAQGNRAYFEVCTHPKLLELARKKAPAIPAKS